MSETRGENYRGWKGKTFRVGRTPSLRFGEGEAGRLGEYLGEFGGRRIALITGAGSYERLPVREELERGLEVAGLSYRRFPVSGEPDPETVDKIRDRVLSFGGEVVLAVGGGSVMDTGKAVAAMCRHSGSVEEYLEGVGRKTAQGLRLPLIAVPTTAGTGAEATKNAVIGRLEEGGYKKSLRHEAFIPDIAVLDPRAGKSVPPEVTAASGMDAVTQLLEAYVSTGASPFTDALALDGLSRAAEALPRAVRNGEDLLARGETAYAAYLSGIVLANAGLGVVHGLASPLGAEKSIPHGVVCAALLPDASELILDKLVERLESESEEKKSKSPKTSESSIALSKYASAGRALAKSNIEKSDLEESDLRDARRLVSLLRRWREEFGIPKLSVHGVDENTARRAAKASGLKKTPVHLDEEEIYGLVLKAAGL